jgi:hypothetical protein
MNLAAKIRKKTTVYNSPLKQLMQVFIHKNEQQLGPFDQLQINELLNSGEFTTDDLAWVEGQSEWIPLGDLIQKDIQTPLVPQKTANVETEPKTIIQTNVQQGAIIGGWVCFSLGIIFMYLSMWSFFIYVPLLIAAFILSIVAMSQRRVTSGIILLLASIIIPSSLGLYLFTLRTTEAVAKAFGVEDRKTVKKIENENASAITNPIPKNIELDKKNGFRNLILGTEYSKLSDLVQKDNSFIEKIFKSKDDESEQYILKENGENIGNAKIDKIALTFNQNLLSKVSVRVSGKQDALILRESLIKAYGQPFSESKRITTWVGEKTRLDLLTEEQFNYAVAEYTNKEIESKINEIILKNKLLKQEEMQKKEEEMKRNAKEAASEGSKSL